MRRPARSSPKHSARLRLESLDGLHCPSVIVSPAAGLAVFALKASPRLDVDSLIFGGHGYLPAVPRCTPPHAGAPDPLVPAALFRSLVTAPNRRAPSIHGPPTAAVEAQHLHRTAIVQRAEHLHGEVHLRRRHAPQVEHAHV